MHLTRTILAVLIALSLAMLPLVGASAMGAKSADVMISDMAQDCCHHGGTCDDHANSVDDHAALGLCAKCCSSLPAIFFADFIAPLDMVVAPVLATAPPPSEIGTPPFRPPRA